MEILNFLKESLWPLIKKLISKNGNYYSKVPNEIREEIKAAKKKGKKLTLNDEKQTEANNVNIVKWGCFMTSLANVFNYKCHIKKKLQIKRDQLYEKAISKGYMTKQCYMNNWPAIANIYGLKQDYFHSAPNIEKAISLINKNNPFIIYMKTGVKTGHFVVCSGYEYDGNGDIQLIIDDPFKGRDNRCDTISKKLYNSANNKKSYRKWSKMFWFIDKE